MMATENLLQDIPELIGLQIKENIEIKQSLAKNDGKFEKLLSLVQQMRSPSTPDAPQKYTNDDLNRVESSIKETAIEHIVLKEKLSNSTQVLITLANRIEAVDQYIKRENLFIDGLSNIPYHLKGYKFTMWLVKVLNNLIPNLDFPILPCHISVCHPLSPKSSRIIMRYAIRDVRNEVFFKKKNITNPNVKITEHLTPLNQKLLDTAQSLLGETNAWSNQTKLYGKVGREVIRINSRDDIDLLLGMKISLVMLRMPPPPKDLQPENSSVPAVEDTSVSVEDTSVSVVSMSSVTSMNLSPLHDSYEIESTWPHLSQNDVTLAMDNFFKPKRAESKRLFSNHGDKPKKRGSKRFLVPPPIHRSYR